MYGEVYGYAHYLQVNYYIPKNVEFFWYDVICKYWPWLKKDDPATSKKMSPALSVMHAKAHDWSCQVLVWLCPILLAYEFFCMDTVWFCFNHEIFYVFWWHSMYINKCNFHVGLVGWSLAEWGSCNYWGGGWAHQKPFLKIRLFHKAYASWRYITQFSIHKMVSTARGC